MAFLHTKIVETRPHDVARDAWREISRRGMRAVADAWHHDILPEHFTERAKYKYRHKLRSVGYRKRKMQAAAAARGISRQNPNPVILGGTVDNVLTGYMMAQLKSSKAIRSYPSRVTLSMYGPRYMTMRAFAGDAKRAMAEGWTYGKGQKFSRFSGNQPDKQREITTVTKEENDRLAAVLEASVARDLASYRATPRTTTV